MILYERGGYFEIRQLAGYARDPVSRPKPQAGRSVAHTVAWRRWRRKVNAWKRGEVRI